MNTASLEVATAIRSLPESLRSEGILSSVMKAYRLGYANKLWTKLHAAKLALQANMERSVAQGKGNRAKRRRNEWASLNQWYDDRRLTISDVDALAELLGEGRIFPKRLNPHDN